MSSPSSSKAIIAALIGNSIIALLDEGDDMFYIFNE